MAGGGVENTEYIPLDSPPAVVEQEPEVPLLPAILALGAVVLAGGLAALGVYLAKRR